MVKEVTDGKKPLRRYLMTATETRKRGNYLFLLGIVLIILPILTGSYAAINKAIHDSESFDWSYAYIVWGYTLFYFAWVFLLLVLIPYSIIYIYVSLDKKGSILKFLVFYGLLVLMGFIAEDASVIESLGPDPYPEAWAMYLFLTLTICPACNAVLNRIVRNKEMGR